MGHQAISCSAMSVPYLIVPLLLLAVVLAAVCLAASRPIVGLLDTPPEAFGDSLLYIRVYFFGLVFTFCFNMISAVFRALGDSRTPLLFLAVSSLLNIALDLYFVLGLHLELCSHRTEVVADVQTPGRLDS